MCYQLNCWITQFENTIQFYQLEAIQHNCEEKTSKENENNTKIMLNLIQ